ncbi:MAG: hypothetical protein WCC06_06790 [Candidatus Aminicenantales bacterium]
MNFIAFVFMLFIASLTGSIGANLAGRKGLGCLTSIVLGFFGALLGTYIAEKLDLPLFFTLRFGTYHFPIIWSICGAALFVAFLNLFSRPKK